VSVSWMSKRCNFLQAFLASTNSGGMESGVGDFLSAHCPLIANSPATLLDGASTSKASGQFWLHVDVETMVNT